MRDISTVPPLPLPGSDDASLLAEAERPPRLDQRPWWELQDWLADGPTDVSIPFATELAKRVPPSAVRMRRDFGMLLGLISAHALLHRATRDKDARGRIVATLNDYAAVKALTEDLVSEGVA